MKKPNPKYLRWHRIRARNQAKRQKQNLFLYGNLQLPAISKMAKDTKRYGMPIPLPEVICFDRNYEQVAELVSKIRGELVRETDEGYQQVDFSSLRRSFKYHTMYGDFTRIKEITPTAALLLAAEYDRVRRVSGLPLYTIDLHQWDPNVRQLLQQLGFLKLLNVVESEVFIIPVPSAITVLPFSTGRKAEGAAATGIVQALHSLFGDIDDPMGLRDCVVEAMTNVTRHAYPDDHDYIYPPHDKRWWLTGSFDADKNKLSIAFVDLGITIPVSLTTSEIRPQTLDYLKKTFQLILGKNDLAHDAEQIQAATHAHVTSMTGGGAGLGLAEMKDFVDASKNGRLRVLSRRGEYIYEKGVGEKIINHKASIGGTLIEWEIWR